MPSHHRLILVKTISLDGALLSKKYRYLRFLSWALMAESRIQPALPPAEGKIEISLNRIAQLFNSLDPSPFHERDLDQDAEEYIVESAEEIGLQRPLTLIIHLPADQVPQGGSHDLGEAIHNYFAYREAHERRRLRLLFCDGRIALVSGLAFLFFCVLLRQLAFSLGSGSAAEILRESMLVIGWVAMWRPLEIFLYEWVPVRRRCRILAKISVMPVIVRPK